MTLTSKYIDGLKKCFHLEIENNSDEIFLSDKDKPELISGIAEKEGRLDDWKNLLNDMRTISNTRIRDVSFTGERHSYKVLLTYSNPTSGITLSISFPFKIYGFYFSRFYFSDVPGRYLLKNSYTAFDDEMVEKKSIIENFTRQHFNNFMAFDNEYADYKIKKIAIDGMYHENLDLWKAFFTTNMFGII